MKLLKPLLGGVELGGTKCVCLIGTGPGDIREQIAIPTGRDANATLSKIETILRDWNAAHGPTAKPGWRDTDVARRLGKPFPVRVGFDTDVNGAALAEGRWGAAKHLADFAYVTVGAGVGAGLVIDGRPVYGFSHSELGHIRVARKPGDVWHGACAFHGDCVEGHALAQLLHIIVLATAPRRILIGGGIDGYAVPPGLGSLAGPLGALALAADTISP